MKRLALAAAAVVLLAPHVLEAGWIQSIPAAQKKAKESKRLIFVDLFADWCGWCHKMEQEVFPSAVFQKQTDDMVLLRLNTEDGGEGTKLAQQYSITSLPTFLVLTPDLGLAGVIRGYAPAVEFSKMVDEVEKKQKDFEMRTAAEASFANDPQKRFDFAREFTIRFQFSQAESRFRKLIGDPKVPTSIRDSAYYELAISQALQSRFDDATKTLAAFSKVQSSGDAYERGRFLQSQIYYQQGNVKGALSELKTFRAKYPNSSLRANVEVMIAQLERSAPGK